MPLNFFIPQNTDANKIIEILNNEFSEKNGKDLTKIIQNKKIKNLDPTEEIPTYIIINKPFNIKKHSVITIGGISDSWNDWFLKASKRS